LEKRTNLLQQGVFIEGLTPSSISIIVAKEGHWPWTKNLLIKERFVTEARAFLVSQDITGTTILNNAYTRIYRAPESNVLLLEKQNGSGFLYQFYSTEDHRQLFAISGQSFLSSPTPFETFIKHNGDLHLLFDVKTVKVEIGSSNVRATLTACPDIDPTLPALPHRIIKDSHENSRIWITNNGTRIMAEWMKESPLPYYFSEKELVVFESPSRIKSIAYYPGRRDIILLAIQNNIFAIELDDRSTRNFQPVYKGRDPFFARAGDALYILDGNALLEAHIPD